MNSYMQTAIEEARTGIHARHGGPFGCVIVKDGEIVGRGHNEVIRQQDPTCHGEVMAIRNACRNLGTFDLTDCELYTTAAPCPMCAGAILWANIRKVYYGCTIADTDAIGFRDQVFYEQGSTDSEELCRSECQALFQEYSEIRDRQAY